MPRWIPNMAASAVFKDDWPPLLQHSSLRRERSMSNHGRGNSLKRSPAQSSISRSAWSSAACPLPAQNDNTCAGHGCCRPCFGCPWAHRQPWEWPIGPWMPGLPGPVHPFQPWSPVLPAPPIPLNPWDKGGHIPAMPPRPALPSVSPRVQPCSPRISPDKSSASGPSSEAVRVLKLIPAAETARNHELPQGLSAAR